MRLGLLLVTLIGNFCLRNVQGTVTSTTTYTLAAVEPSKCTELASQCKAPADSLVLDKCRANSNPDCKLDATMTVTQDNVEGVAVKDEAKALIIKVEVKSLGFSIEKLTITTDSKPASITGAVKVIRKAGDALTANEEVTKWILKQDCTVTNGAITCQPKATDILEIGKYNIAVLSADGKVVKIDKSSKVVVNMVRKGSQALPLLGMSDVKFSMGMSQECQENNGECSKTPKGTVTDVLTCVGKYTTKPNCKVTPRIHVEAKKDLSPILIGKAETALPYVGITLTALDQKFGDVTKLRYESIDFKLSKDITNPVNAHLQISNEKTQVIWDGDFQGVQTNARGKVSGLDHKKVEHDFTTLMVVGLTDAAAGTTFKPVIVLAGAERLLAEGHKVENDDQQTKVKQHSQLTVDSFTPTTGTNTCNIATVSECQHIGAKAIANCIAKLASSPTCKQADVKLSTTLSGVQAAGIKIGAEDVSAFSIGTVKDTDHGLGLTKTDSGKKVDVNIVKIGGKFKTAGNFELFKLNFDQSKNTFAKVGGAIGSVTVAAADVNQEKSFTTSSLVLTEGDAFGVIQRKKRSRNLQDMPRDEAAPVTVQFTDIKIQIETTIKPSEIKSKTETELTFAYTLTSSNASATTTNGDAKETCGNQIKTPCTATSNKINNINACQTAVKASTCEIEFHMTFTQSSPSVVPAVDSRHGPIIKYTNTPLGADVTTTEVISIGVVGADTKLKACKDKTFEIFSGKDIHSAFTKVADSSAKVEEKSKKFVITGLTPVDGTFYQLRAAEASCDITESVTISYELKIVIDKRASKPTPDTAAKDTYKVQPVDSSKCDTTGVVAAKCDSITTLGHLNRCRVNSKPDCSFTVTLDHEQGQISPSKTNKAGLFKLKMNNLGGFKLKSVTFVSESLDIPTASILQLVNSEVTESTTITTPVDKCECKAQTCNCKSESSTEFMADTTYTLAVFNSQKAVVPFVKEFKVTAVLERVLNRIPVIAGDEVKYLLSGQTNCKSEVTCGSDKRLSAAELTDCLPKLQKADCKITPKVSLVSAADIAPVITGFETTKEAVGFAAVFVDPVIFTKGIFGETKTISKINFGVTGKIATSSLIIDSDLNVKTHTPSRNTADAKGAVTITSNEFVAGDAGQFFFLDKPVGKDGKFKPEFEFSGVEITNDGKDDKDLTTKLATASAWTSKTISVKTKSSSCKTDSAPSCKSLQVKTVGDCITELKASPTCKDATISLNAKIEGLAVPYKLDTNDMAAFQVKTIQDSNLHLGLAKKEAGVDIIVKKVTVQADNSIKGETSFDLFTLDSVLGKYSKSKKAAVLKPSTSTPNSNLFTGDLTQPSVVGKEGVLFGVFKSGSSYLFRRRNLGAAATGLKFSTVEIELESSEVKVADLSTDGGSPGLKIVPRNPNGAASLLAHGFILVFGVLLSSYA